MSLNISKIKNSLSVIILDGDQKINLSLFYQPFMNGIKIILKNNINDDCYRFCRD